MSCLCFVCVYSKPVDTVGDLKKALEPIPDNVPLQGDFMGDSVSVRHMREEDSGQEYCQIMDRDFDDVEDES